MQIRFRIPKPEKTRAKMTEIYGKNFFVADVEIDVGAQVQIRRTEETRIEASVNGTRIAWLDYACLSPDASPALGGKFARELDPRALGHMQAVVDSLVLGRWTQI